MGETVLYSYCPQRQWFKRTGEWLIPQLQEGEKLEVQKEEKKKEKGRNPSFLGCLLIYFGDLFSILTHNLEISCLHKA